ncbi:hypothetical protein DA2_1110 [Desulfovibrio sp. A2]|nr:hypothetical protein DA2_1110 [Desulfovibrio sp. A2]
MVARHGKGAALADGPLYTLYIPDAAARATPVLHPPRI